MATKDDDSAVNIAELIEKVVRDRIDNDSVRAVQIAIRHDDEGDKLYVVNIIMKGRKRPEISRASSLSRHILSKLSELHDPGFPILSFIAASELGKATSETA